MVERNYNRDQVGGRNCNRGQAGDRRVQPCCHPEGFPQPGRAGQPLHRTVLGTVHLPSKAKQLEEARKALLNTDRDRRDGGAQPATGPPAKARDAVPSIIIQTKILKILLTIIPSFYSDSSANRTNASIQEALVRSFPFSSWGREVSWARMSVK